MKTVPDPMKTPVLYWLQSLFKNVNDAKDNNKNGMLKQSE